MLGGVLGCYIQGVCYFQGGVIIQCLRYGTSNINLTSLVLAFEVSLCRLVLTLFSSLFSDL